MIDQMKKNKKLIIDSLLVIAYAITSFIILVYHEPWRDEAQQWLICRDLNIGQIFSQMKYEGHFVLWYMILLPFVKLGFPYFTANIVSWLICVISVCLIVFKSPLKTWVKILFIFSLPMVYFYPAIARCYCLIPLAVSLISIAYRNRRNNPIVYMISIVLLLNTHVIMLGLVGILILLFFIEEVKEFKNMTTKEKKKFIFSLLIGFILSLASILPLFGSIETNEMVSIKFLNISEILDKLIVYINLYWRSIVFFEIDNILDIFLLLILTAILILLIIIYECNRSNKYFVILFTSISFQIVLYILLYDASQQRLYSLAYILLLVIWMQNEDFKELESKQLTWKRRLKNFIIIAIFMLNIINGFRFCIIPEIKYNYSSSKETAKYINNNLPKDSIIISNKFSYTSAIIPYTKNIKYYNIISQEYFTFFVWDGKKEDKLNEELYNRMIDIKKEKNNVYYILIKEDKNDYVTMLEQEEKLVKKYESKNSLIKEDYIIYDICL